MTSAASPAPDRVFLVVVDDSAELEVALRYACRRARKTGGRVALLAVVEPSDDQHWMAVGDLMKEEARAAAEQMLQKLSERTPSPRHFSPVVQHLPRRNWENAIRHFHARCAHSVGDRASAS